jgi:hypothetical protein
LKRELGLSAALLTFEDLDDLLETLTDRIEAHSQAIAGYGDLLGTLLRGNNSSNPDGSGIPDPSDTEMQQSRKRSGGVEGGWLTNDEEEYSLKVAVTNTSSKEASSLFKIVESLKSKLVMLQAAHKFLSDLPSQGIKPDQRFHVIFREGVPREVIPTNVSAVTGKKFKYAGSFELKVLKAV